MCLSAHGVEVGAKLAMFPFDETTREVSRGRTDKPYEPLAADADAQYEREIVLDVDTMPFVVAKPHQFGNVGPVRRGRGTADPAGDHRLVRERPLRRHRDRRARARKDAKSRKGVRFLISPASQQVYLQCVKAGTSRRCSKPARRS